MDLSLKALEEAVSIRQQIDTLEKRLASILGTASRSLTHEGPRKMSPQARAKIAAAMTARWAKKKKKVVTAPTAKRSGGISAAGRRKLSQLMKARWAARKKAGHS
jgi:hypothetical protein